MRQKLATAVYNPQEPLEQRVQQVCHRYNGEWLTAQQTKGLIEAVVGYDGLFEEFLTDPKSTLEEMLEDDNERHIYIPCHALELRQIIRNRVINAQYCIGGFGARFAKRNLLEYPILLVFDVSKIQENPILDLGNVKVYDQEIHFTGALLNVLCRDRFDSEIYQNAQSIINDEYPEASVNTFGDVPGIAMPKAAQTQVQVQMQPAPMQPPAMGLQKYIVNASLFGISDEIIKSHSEEQALDEALTRAWKKTNNPHRDPKYTAKFWIEQGMLPLMVEVYRGEPSKHIAKVAAIEGDSLNIELNSTEEKIFNFLTGVSDKYSLGLTFRAAGGWVRDKALGKESDDIDIALDKMTGAEFGKYLQKETGKGGAVIKANPEQSKQLETMTITLFGQDVDFVNLRSERYTTDSRIPTMEIGSPEEDAERRDLTINSLFYNINSRQVEDFTGKGIADLKTMTLRTPLDPTKTFTDDPLRVLRLLRFFSRYKGSNIDPTALAAMKDQGVQQALKQKVSPERMLTEWKKLFSGSQQSAALRVLHDTGIWDNVLKPEGMKDFAPFPMDQKNKWHVDTVLDHSLKVLEKYDEILRADGAGDDERANALAASFLHDIGKLSPEMNGIKPTLEGVFRTYHSHEDISAEMAKAVMQGLKASNDDVEYIHNIVQNHMLPHNDMSDKQVRKLIRNLGRSMVKRIVQHARADADSKPGADLGHYDNLINKVNTLEPSAPDGNAAAPVVNGNVLIGLFPQLHPASGFIKEINTRLQDMKDEYPNLTEQEALVAVEQMRPEIQQQFGAYQGKQKAPKKLPTPPKPAVITPVQPVVPNNNTVANGEVSMKTSQTSQRWYDEMRDKGERQETVVWMCGTVAKENVSQGRESEHIAVSLYTHSGVYRLQYQGGNTFNDASLMRLSGKDICAKGFIKENSFMISEYRINENAPGQDVTYLERETPKEMASYKPGGKVRHRKRGMSFDQITGTIDKIEGDLMYVRWQGMKDLEVFNLTDTIALHALLEHI